MAQESDQSPTNSDAGQNMKQTLEKPPNVLSKFEKLSKSVSHIKCKIITVDEIVTVVNAKEKGLSIIINSSNFEIYLLLFFF